MRCRPVGLAQPAPLKTAWHLMDQASGNADSSKGGSGSVAAGGACVPQHHAVACAPAAGATATPANHPEGFGPVAQVLRTAPDADDDLIQQAHQYITSLTRHA